MSDLNQDVPEMVFEQTEDQDDEIILEVKENSLDTAVEEDKDKPSYEELLQNYQKLQADRESSQKTAIELLAEEFGKASKSQQPQQQVMPQFNLEEFREKLKDGLFGEKPDEALDLAIDRKLKPLLAQFGQITSEMQKKLMKTDPKDGELFDKYEQEILSSIPPEHVNNPQAVTHYFKLWKADNIDKVVEIELNKRLDKLKLPQAGKERFEPGKQQAPTKKQRKVSLTAEEERLLTVKGYDCKHLAANGIDPRDYLNTPGVK